MVSHKSGPSSRQQEKRRPTRPHLTELSSRPRSHGSRSLWPAYVSHFRCVSLLKCCFLFYFRLLVFYLNICAPHAYNTYRDHKRASDHQETRLRSCPVGAGIKPRSRARAAGADDQGAISSVSLPHPSCPVPASSVWMLGKALWAAGFRLLCR